MPMDAKMASHWWMQKGEAQAAALWEHLKGLEQRERMRRTRDQVNERIYASNVAGGPRGVDMAAMLRTIGFTSADLNFVRQIIDALVARIGNNTPAIRVAADGADWTQRRDAKLADKVIGGEMERMDLEHEGPLLLRAALTTRAGCFKVEPHNGEIVGERVPVDEFLVDDREARYGKPRQLHQEKQVACEVLLRDYPQHSEAIRNAEPAKKREGDLSDETMLGGETNMVDVACSWHLPSSKDADDGVRVISMRNRVLDTAPLKRPRFPVVFMRWSPPQKGFWGCCLVDELAALQYKVNEISRDLMQNIYFTSAVAVLTRRGANVEKKKLAGKQPYFVEVDSPADVVWAAPDGFSPAQFQFLQWMIQQMYDVSGVSQLMAQSKNPLGAGASGAALENFYDIESERFSQTEKDYARLHRQIGELIVDAARDLSEDREFRKRPVKWVKRGVLQKGNWGDIESSLTDDDRYQLHLEAAGYLPKTRAGKMQAIEQLIANGFLDAKWAPSLFDFPDLEQANMIRSAPIDYAIACLEQIADCAVDKDGEVVEDKSEPVPVPDEHADLDLCMAVGKAALLQSIANKDPEGVRARYRTWCELVDTEMKKAAPAAMGDGLGGAALAPPGPAVMSPMGMPPMAGQPMPPAMPPAPMGAPTGPTGMPPDVPMAA